MWQQFGNRGRGRTAAKNRWVVFKGTSIDGSIAYQQFRHSSNPYAPIFINNCTGTVTVEPLQLVKPKNDKTKKNDRARMRDRSLGHRSVVSELLIRAACRKTNAVSRLLS